MQEEKKRADHIKSMSGERLRISMMDKIRESIGREMGGNIHSVAVVVAR